MCSIMPIRTKWVRLVKILKEAYVRVVASITQGKVFYKIEVALVHQ